MSDPFTPPVEEINKWLDTSLPYTLKRIEGSLCCTHLVIGYEDADMNSFRVLRMWKVGGDWQTSVDLQGAGEFEVFEELLDRIAEVAGWANAD